MEIGNLPEKEFRIMIVKMIQSQENNKEVERIVYQRLRKTKEQTEMNNTLERINSRITGGQTGGSHCCRTEYRRKNEKK